jgi:hypothetical protein
VLLLDKLQLPHEQLVLLSEVPHVGGLSPGHGFELFVAALEVLVRFELAEYELFGCGLLLAFFARLGSPILSLIVCLRFPTLLLRGSWRLRA